MKKSTSKYIFSFGAPFALIPLDFIHDWFGATGLDGEQYETLLQILESLELDFESYNIINCEIDDIYLTIFDNSSNIYKISDKKLFQLEYINQGVDFSEIKMNPPILKKTIKVNIQKGTYALFDSACEFSDLKTEENYFIIKIDSNITHVVVSYHNSTHYSGWDIELKANLRDIS